MFCAKHNWLELVLKHNSPSDDSYHLHLVEFVVIGCEVIAERDIARIHFSSPGMLAKSLSNFSQRNCSCWGFRLHTSNFCRSNLDLVEFWVNSIPCQNNLLCLSLIPKGTESEKVYQITWDDLGNAIILMCCVVYCGDPCYVMCFKVH